MHDPKHLAAGFPAQILTATVKNDAPLEETSRCEKNQKQSYIFCSTMLDETKLPFNH